MMNSVIPDNAKWKQLSVLGFGGLTNDVTLPTFAIHEMFVSALNHLKLIHERNYNQSSQDILTRLLESTYSDRYQ